LIEALSNLIKELEKHSPLNQGNKFIRYFRTPQSSAVDGYIWLTIKNISANIFVAKNYFAK
jgi:hypothetical protein